MKRKKLLISITSLVLICIFSTLVIAEDSLLNFTFKSSKESALENTTQTTLDALDIEIKESNLDDANEDADDNDYTGGDRCERLDRRIIVEVDPLIAEYELEISKMKQQDNQRKLNKDTYVSSMNILLTQKELEKEIRKLEIFEEKYNQTEVKYDNGNISATELLNSEYDLENQKIQVELTKNKLLDAEYDFKNLLNISLDSNISIDEELIIDEIINADIEAKLIECLANDITIYEKQKKYEAMKIKYDLTANEYKEYTKERNSAKFEMETAKLELDEAKTNLEVNLKNKYNELLNYYDQYELAKQYHELNQKKMNNSLIRFEIGNISKEELLTQREQFIEAEYSLYQSIFDYNKCKAEFEYSFTTVFSD